MREIFLDQLNRKLKSDIYINLKRLNCIFKNKQVTMYIVTFKTVKLLLVNEYDCSMGHE